MHLPERQKLYHMYDLQNDQAAKNTIKRRHFSNLKKILSNQLQFEQVLLNFLFFIFGYFVSIIPIQLQRHLMLLVDPTAGYFILSTS